MSGRMFCLGETLVSSLGTIRSMHGKSLSTRLQYQTKKSKLYRSSGTVYKYQEEVEQEKKSQLFKYMMMMQLFKKLV